MRCSPKMLSVGRASSLMAERSLIVRRETKAQKPSPSGSVFERLILMRPVPWSRFFEVVPYQIGGLG